MTATGETGSVSIRPGTSYSSHARLLHGPLRAWVSSFFDSSQTIRPNVSFHAAPTVAAGEDPRDVRVVQRRGSRWAVLIADVVAHVRPSQAEDIVLMAERAHKARIEGTSEAGDVSLRMENAR